MRTSHACWLIPVFNRQSLFHFYSIQEIDNVRNMKLRLTPQGQKREHGFAAGYGSPRWRLAPQFYSSLSVISAT
jgi:hypothetical protein